MHFARSGRKEKKTVQKGKVFCVCSETLCFLACSSFLPTPDDGSKCKGVQLDPAALHPIPLPGAWRGHSTLCSRTPELIKAAAAGVASRGGAQTGWRGVEKPRSRFVPRSRRVQKKVHAPAYIAAARRPGFGEGRESSPAPATRPPGLQWKSRRRRLLAARATSDPGN